MPPKVVPQPLTLWHPSLAVKSCDLSLSHGSALLHCSVLLYFPTRSEHFDLFVYYLQIDKLLTLLNEACVSVGTPSTAVRMRPVLICCMSSPLSLPLSNLSSHYHKGRKAPKILKKTSPLCICKRVYACSHTYCMWNSICAYFWMSLCGQMLWIKWPAVHVFHLLSV